MVTTLANKPDRSISMSNDTPEGKSSEDVSLVRRLKRGNNKPVINVEYSSENGIPEEVPRTVEGAVSSVYAEQRRLALDEGMESLNNNETWHLDPKSANKDNIGCKRVFIMK
uniref:Uncharacterized protein n=1 Tax=Bracon brevicornis TaxID=1563983 RepID=A0A6V7JKP1_9HYME